MFINKQVYWNMDKHGEKVSRRDEIDALNSEELKEKTFNIYFNTSLKILIEKLFLENPKASA